MDSPMDPGSPESSISSPSTPPPDEPSVMTATPAMLMGMGSTPSKRRLPSGPGVFGREMAAKTRRKDQGGARWSEGKERRKDEELVDVALMEELKKQLGDPFDESSQRASS
ncbi:hypothetical protein NEOLEDRAFT_1143645 [Neolentinus lepideus HHB14362 ss-1]|uniref:Uncharacterized protein n=1 Tax=Neolentinus lepideus HHB14362 ss-1 TaxID=1314782 RepID=A0A165MEX7_9AGAM|nr:hypothetical protein NEOLEDRAFT_1143645 [Neolentinus lepideus HHB14362 ss-1]